MQLAHRAPAEGIYESKFIFPRFLVEETIRLMKRIFDNAFFSLRMGARLLLLLFAFAYPLALAGHYSHTFEVYSWAAFSPIPVLKQLKQR